MRTQSTSDPCAQGLSRNNSFWTGGTFDLDLQVGAPAQREHTIGHEAHVASPEGPDRLPLTSAAIPCTSWWAPML